MKTGSGGLKTEIKRDVRTGEKVKARLLTCLLNGVACTNLMSYTVCRKCNISATLTVFISALINPKRHEVDEVLFQKTNVFH